MKGRVNGNEMRCFRFFIAESVSWEIIIYVVDRNISGKCRAALCVFEKAKGDAASYVPIKATSRACLFDGQFGKLAVCVEENVSDAFANDEPSAELMERILPGDWDRKDIVGPVIECDANGKVFLNGYEALEDEMWFP